MLTMDSIQDQYDNFSIQDQYDNFSIQDKL